MRRISRTRFGHYQPPGGVINVSVFPVRPEVFVPDHVDPMDLENDLQNRLTCFAQFDQNETNYDTDRLHPPLTSEHYVKYVPHYFSVQDTEDDNDAETVDNDAETVEMDTQEILHQDITPSASPPVSESITNFYIYEEYPLAKPPNSPCIQMYMILINEIVLKSEDKEKLIIEYKPFKICQDHLTCFKPGPGQWIQDDIMDYYLALLAARNKTDRTKYANVYTFRATFYALLSQAKGLDLVKLSADGDNIFDYELLFFPICMSHHWRLLVVNVAERKVTSYNSMQKSTKDLLIAKNIVRYLAFEYQRVSKNAAGGSLKNLPDWNIQLDGDMPQQNNGDDCGIFALLYADYLSSRKAFDFDASQILYFRAKMLYECISGRLMISNE